MITVMEGNAHLPGWIFKTVRDFRVFGDTYQLTILAAMNTNPEPFQSKKKPDKSQLVPLSPSCCMQSLRKG